MRLTMVLCDAVEQVNGKLYILGGGWTHVATTGASVSMGLGVIIAVPWTDANRRHPISVALMDDDGHPVTMGDQEVRNEGQFEIGRPPGTKPGSDLNAVMAFQFGGLVLEPGGYVWELRVGDNIERTPFWAVGGNG